MNDSPNRDVVIFTEAVELAADERAGYLERACGGDAELRLKVEALLHTHDHVGDFLEASPQKAAIEANAGSSTGENVGDRIGRYKLLQQIGEGGWGVVFMAEQDEPVRRKVALKIVKPGMDSKNVIARFEAERQALALMDHPNIAHVLDAGATENGRPYFVMELVRGIKITDYCDQSHMPTANRLELFIQVCNAVQHAHQKGIIHRDIKPSNILVTTSEEGKPLPKVIDFGIAKAATGVRLTDKTLFTAFEMLIGTPAYMSPEQAALTSLDVDTRTDIYSLGVLLYELLTSTTPFDTRELLKAGLDEVRRVIQTEEPVRPSTRLRTMMVADLTAASDLRKAQPPNLIREMRGDLDWIVMKTLEKDRTRRYQTANSLADDVQRYLADETVSARPPSAFYKLRKLAMRNKLVFGGAVLMLVLLVSALTITTWSLSKEKQALRASEMNEEKARAEAVANRQTTRFLAEMLKGAGPAVALGRDTTILREIVDRAADRIGKEFTNQPTVEFDLRLTMGEVYMDLGLFDKAEDIELAALAISRKQPSQDDERTAFALLDLAIVHTLQPKLEIAEKEVREALSIETRLHRDEMMPVVSMESELASILARRGDAAGAVALYHKALATVRRLVGDHAPETMDVINGLEVALQSQRKWAEAESLAREVLSSARAFNSSDSPFLATAEYNLANILEREDKLPEAEDLCRDCVATLRKTLDAGHPLFGSALGGLGFMLAKAGKWQEAEETYGELLAIRRKAYGNGDPRVVDTFIQLEVIMANSHQEAEIDRLFHELSAAAAPKSAQASALWQNRVEYVARRSHWVEGAEAATRALEIRPDDPRNYHALAPLLVETGNLSAYDELCKKIITRFSGTNDVFVADEMAKDCLILPRPGANLKAAGELASTAVALGKGAQPYVFFECCKALAEYRQGHWNEAVDWSRRAATNSFPFSQAEALAILSMGQYKLDQVEAARTNLANCENVVQTKLPRVGAEDLGGDWRDWIIAHALLTEAQNLLGTLPATLNSSQPVNK